MEVIGAFIGITVWKFLGIVYKVQFDSILMFLIIKICFTLSTNTDYLPSDRLVLAFAMLHRSHC